MLEIHKDGALRSVDLAPRLHVSQSLISAVLYRMVKDKQLYLIKSTRSGACHRYRLTTESLALLREAYKHATGVDLP